MSYYSKTAAPRKTSKLYAMVTAMIESKRFWSYSEMSEFGFKMNHARDYDKKADRGYWSVNINWAKGSGYVAKNASGLYYVTDECIMSM